MSNGATLTSGEEAQLLQTIEMFEVITQSQPQDYQSLEILKEAYAKLDREEDVVRTAKRIAQVYVSLGQLSSAILEYESILQRYPDDADVLAALGEIESRAGNLSSQGGAPEPQPETPKLPTPPPKIKPANIAPKQGFEATDGRAEMQKVFVDSKLVTPGQFEQCWTVPDSTITMSKPAQAFIQLLAGNQILPIEKSLRILTDKTKLGYLAIDKYELDLDLARSFSAQVCFRHCILPFDKMSKAILVATCNPFNRQAALEIESVIKLRIQWYLVGPEELHKVLRRVFR